jgi:RND superfamily putative drug exporter
MLERVALYSYRHRWRALALWIVALVAVGFLGSAFSGDYARDFSLPGAESQKAFDLLKERFHSRSGGTVDVVFRAPEGVSDPSVRSAMGGYFSRLEGLPHVDFVADPYRPQPGESAGISKDGTIAYAEVQFNIEPQDVSKDEANRLIDLGDGVEQRVQGLEIEYSGFIIAQAEQSPPGGAEAVGLGAAIIILLLTFGSLLAMVLPILCALFGIGIGLSLLSILANVIAVPDFTPQVAAMIGIGVGIDYALFIVTRYRQGLHQNREPEEATLLALATAGRAVVFAGTVVVISLLGVLLMGFAFMQGIAVGGSAAVFVTMLASVTLLPAMLGFVGRNVDRLRLPLPRKKVGGSITGRGGWYRWSRLIQRRPILAGSLGLAVVIVLALPLFSMRLGSADAGNDPPDLTTRRAYDLLSKGFGPGFNGPLLLAATLSDRGDVAALERVRSVLERTPGVATALPPVVNPQGNTAIMTVYPSTAPQDAATTELVNRLRNEVIPQATRGTGVQVLVGGITGIFADFAHQIGRRLPILIGVVILLSFLLLMMVFRSIVVPIKAAVMNLLSIGAAYGVMVAVFQWGWASSVFGVGKPGPVEAWIPTMMFTILFGLSMDYEIFLLSRIREEYVRTRDNAEAVANGLAYTGRVISAAALVMIAVFLSFVLGFDVRQVKEIGLGLAVAIFIDASIVRVIIVPSLMEVLGDANWWLPKRLERFLPKWSVEISADDLDRELAELRQREPARR